MGLQHLDATTKLIGRVMPSWLRLVFAVGFGMSMLDVPASARAAVAPTAGEVLRFAAAAPGWTTGRHKTVTAARTAHHDSVGLLADFTSVVTRLRESPDRVYSRIETTELARRGSATSRPSEATVSERILADNQHAVYMPAAHFQLARHRKDVDKWRGITKADTGSGGFLEGWLSSEAGEIRAVPDFARAAGDRLAVAADEVEGEHCYRVDAHTDEYGLTFWVAPAKGYNLIKYEFKSKKATKIKYAVRVSKVKLTTVDGRWVSREGTYECEYSSGSGDDEAEPMREVVSVRRTLIDLNPAAFDQSLFTLARIPDGMKVFVEDMRDSPLRHVWRDGEPKPAVDDAATARIRAQATGAANPAAVQQPFAANSSLPSWIARTLLAVGVGVGLLLVWFACEWWIYPRLRRRS